MDSRFLSYFTLLICIAAVQLLIGCTRSVHQSRLVIKKSKEEVAQISKQLKPKHQRRIITIWIHGTRLAPQGFMKNFFFCPDGITPAKLLAPNYHIRTIADTLSSAAPQFFPFDSYYLYGWSGALSVGARDQAAQKLAEELTILIKKYEEKEGITPLVQIIGHSHGGNVALLLGKYQELLPTDCHINKVILLACPIQKATACYATSELFESIYNFYSTIDTIQILDPQIFHNRTANSPFFSERCFTQNEKIVQTQIKIDGRGIMHIEFILPRFLKLLPFIIHTSTEWSHIKNKNEKYHLIHLKTK